MKNVFKDTQMLYDILMDFYELLKKDPGIGPELKKTNMCIQFVYHNPNGIITIDTREKKFRILPGDFDDEPEVTMRMDADFALMTDAVSGLQSRVMDLFGGEATS